MFWCLPLQGHLSEMMILPCQLPENRLPSFYVNRFKGAQVKWWSCLANYQRIGLLVLLFTASRTPKSNLVLPDIRKSLCNFNGSLPLILVSFSPLLPPISPCFPYPFLPCPLPWPYHAYNPFCLNPKLHFSIFSENAEL